MSPDYTSGDSNNDEDSSSSNGNTVPINVARNDGSTSSTNTPSTQNTDTSIKTLPPLDTNNDVAIGPIPDKPLETNTPDTVKSAPLNNDSISNVIQPIVRPHKGFTKRRKSLLFALVFAIVAGIVIIQSFAATNL